jgi:DNA-binding MarR family transcriptional regulator
MDRVQRYTPRGFDCVCGNLRMASRTVSSIYDRHLRGTGLRSSQLAVLWAIAALSPATVKTTARRISMDETTLLRNLAVLQRRKLVAVDVGTDRRERLLSLTDAGRDAFAAALPKWERAQAEMAEALQSSLGNLNRQLVRLAQVPR